MSYEGHVWYPGLPQGADRVTLLTPGTTAEVPGVPVRDGGSPPDAPSERPTGTPAPGDTVVLAAKKPSEARERKVEDLYDIVEGTTASTLGGGGDETITFPADVLFAFDSAALTGRARRVIAQAAADLKSRSDPAKPITIEGHTDGKGLLSRNRPLSEQRAAAVRDALARHLSGESRTFQVSGKADSEPVAKETTEDGADNPAGRARNRRVEITYALRPSQGAAPGGGALKRGEPGEPAAPRRPGGTVVAERTATVDTSNGTGGERFRLRLFPSYRDGAYMVLAFELTNIGPGKLNRVAGLRGYFSADDFVGGDYGSFRVTAADGTVYRAVRLGVPKDQYTTPGYLTGSIILGYPNVPQRTYMYVPAPPRAGKSYTLDAGAFGKVPDLPIE